jgi:ubiquinone/menaquinone biosynthesis C-methylase UbiE
MQRRVEPEWLDELPADDPRALQSRKDLEKLNSSMGNAAIVEKALRAAFAGRTPRRIAELGAGDGRFALSVARSLAGDWSGTRFVLVDRLNAVRNETRASFEQLGWSAESVQADAFDWLSRTAVSSCDAMVANLFLHHFSEAQLTGLFRIVASRARVFVAVEPRRSGRGLFVTRLLWVIGCNEVTRHDAPVSARAGFTRRELSQLWPTDGGWSLLERPAGWFSHLFVARART